MCPPGVLQHISPSLMRPCETVSGQGTTEERGLSSPCTIKSLLPLCSLCERAVPQPCRKGARCYLQNTIFSTYKHLSPLSSSYSHLKTCSTPASGPLTLLSFHYNISCTTKVKSNPSITTFNTSSRHCGMGMRSGDPPCQGGAHGGKKQWLHPDGGLQGRSPVHGGTGAAWRGAPSPGTAASLELTRVLMQRRGPSCRAGHQPSC